MDNVHYQEVTKPHTQHEEIRDKLARLDTKIERAKGWVYSWEALGETTRDFRESLSKAESLSDEAEKAWRNTDYNEADKLIDEAYDFLAEIPPPPAPPAFAITTLSISPTDVNTGELVTISILVTNTGDATGTYTAILKIDNVVVTTKDVTLAGGASQMVTFTTSQDIVGNYVVNVDSLSGTFVVKAAMNWWLIGGVIACTVIIGVIISRVVRRRWV